MPRGITDQFLLILQAESRRAIRLLAVGLGALLLALFLADLADTPRFGEVTAVFAIVAALATFGSGWWERRRAHARTKDLADRWSSWMRYSVSSGSIGEIERKVNHEEAASPWIPGAVTSLFILANAAVFALLWVEHAVALPAAFGIAVANGVGVGWILGSRALLFHWARSATEAAQELVGNGTLAVWGER